MIEKKTWKEFKDTGLLWLVNSLLHLFGWAICLEVNEGVVTDVFPARVKFRGFSESNNTEGYKKISQYMRDNAEALLQEAKE